MRNSIFIDTASTVEIVDFDCIIRVEAKENYCMVYLLEGKNILSNISLSSMLQRLNDHFYQCHKSHIINLYAIQRIYKDGRIEMSNNMIVPLARRRKEGLMKLMIEFFSNKQPTDQSEESPIN